MEDLNSKIEELRACCLAKRNTFQPVIIIVGKPDKILGSYIVIDDVKYKLSSPTRALDVCFQSFQGLNCCYPDACQPIWTFLQKFIYGITTAYDKNYSSVNKLIDSLM